MIRTYIGYKPFEHQKAVHDYISEIGPKAGYIICCKSKRQVGKSAMIEQELLRSAINNKNSTSILVTLTYPNCKKIFNEMLNGIKGTGVLSKENESDMELHFINGSTILFKSCVIKDRLRGYTIKNGGICVVDEAAYIPDDVFAIIAPWCDVHKANMILVSTPRLKQGFFYEYYNEGCNGSKSVKSFDFNNYDTSFLLSEEKLELYRKLMPKNQFISDYLGQFVDDLGSVFDLSKNIFITNERPCNDIFIGIDWANGNNGDYTSISAFDSNGIQVGLDYTNGLSPVEQIQWISNIIHSKYAKYKIINIICESNSIGTVYIADLEKALGSGYPITKFNTTNSSKREIIEYMIKRIGEESVKFINDSEFYSQLSAYQMEITQSGQITYNGYLKHDDLIMSSAFALYGIKKLEKTGNYSVSVLGGRSRGKSKIRSNYR